MRSYQSILFRMTRNEQGTLDDNILAQQLGTEIILVNGDMGQDGNAGVGEKCLDPGYILIYD